MSRGSDYIRARFLERSSLLAPDQESLDLINRVHSSWRDGAEPLSMDDVAASATFADAEPGRYLQEIAEVATRLTSAVIEAQFGYQPTQSMNAISGEVAEGEWIVHLDEHLRVFLFAFCVNRALRIYGNLDSAQASETKHLALLLIDGFFQPSSHFDIHKEMIWAFSYDEDITQIGHNVSNAILCFIFAHELAHIVLKHRSGSDQTIEFEADRLALEVFFHLVEERDYLEWTGIPTLYDCAPLILFDIRALLDRHRISRGGRQSDETHPPPAMRLTRLQDIGAGRFSEDGRDLRDAFHGSLDELLPS